MNKYADLHIHSNVSDGSFTPQEIINCAVKAGLSCIAITDHDTIDNVEELIKEGQKYNIEVIPGIELSAEYKNIELHILGYFINYKSAKFKNKIDFLRQTRFNRAEQILKKLQQVGINIHISEIEELAKKDAALGRLHIARLLLQKGFVSSIGQAFRQYIGNNQFAFVPKYKLTPAEASNLIEEAEGIPILAHPQVINNDSIVNEILAFGIKGLEVYHTEHDANGEKRHLKIAKEKKLLITGGSDCHGISKQNILIGKVKFPYQYVQNMKDYLKSKNKKTEYPIKSI